MKTIDRTELKRMIDGSEAVVVEVLGEEKFREFHLPGAINVPLGDGFEERIRQAVPDKEQAVVVYCANEDCNASPKAAERMESIGYRNVLDYAAGKEDWKDAKMPVVT